MQTTTRREFARQSLGSLLAFSLVDTLCRCDALAAGVKPVVVEWLREVNQLGFDLKESQLKQVEWQKKIEQLYARVDLPELLELVDFEQLTKNVKLVDKGARSLRFRFEADGSPEKLSFGRQIFAVKKGRSVVPHGHNNMSTAFLVIKGKFHGRHYDRLTDEDQHYIIKPTIDETFGPGGCSTVSDFKDNVHWFESLEEPSYIFNIHVIHRELDDQRSTGRVYLDPNGEKLKDGLIRAPQITYKQANERYG